MSLNDIYRERVYKNQGFPELVNIIGNQPCRVLDIGCGCGANLRMLRERGHEVCGLTLSESEAAIVSDRGFSCRVWDITSETLPFPAQSFDALLFCHVLEHIASPEVVLRRYTQLLKPKGKVYVALPNAMQFMQRWQFLLGRFRYTETGIMDRTHLRFFDFYTARKLLEGAGINVDTHFGVGYVPLGIVRQVMPNLAKEVDRFISRRWPSLFAFHIVLVGIRE